MTIVALSFALCLSVILWILTLQKTNELIERYKMQRIQIGNLTSDLVKAVALIYEIEDQKESDKRQMIRFENLNNRQDMNTRAMVVRISEIEKKIKNLTGYPE